MNRDSIFCAAMVPCTCDMLSMLDNWSEPKLYMHIHMYMYMYNALYLHVQLHKWPLGKCLFGFCVFVVVQD